MYKCSLFILKIKDRNRISKISLISKQKQHIAYSLNTTYVTIVVSLAFVSRYKLYHQFLWKTPINICMIHNSQRFYIIAKE